VECETRTSPGFRSDNDWSFVSFGTNSVWATLTIRAVPFRTSRADCSAGQLRRFASTRSGTRHRMKLLSESCLRVRSPQLSSEPEDGHAQENPAQTIASTLSRPQ
jgi:hypothetical protein